VVGISIIAKLLVCSGGGTMTDALSQLIARLCSPLSGNEMADGWTTKSKTAIANYFRKVKEGSEKANIGLVRGLDAWGVSSGSLFDECLSVNRTLVDALNVRSN